MLVLSWAGGSLAPVSHPILSKPKRRTLEKNSKTPRKAHFPLLPQTQIHSDSSVYQPSITREETTRWFLDTSVFSTVLSCSLLL